MEVEGGNNNDTETDKLNLALKSLSSNKITSMNEGEKSDEEGDGINNDKKGGNDSDNYWPMIDFDDLQDSLPSNEISGGGGRVGLFEG